MFNMFVQTKYVDERQDVASDWFTNSSEMLGTALNCELCLGGMKVVQWFFASHFLVDGLIGVGDSLCYVLRNKFMYDSCSGYVEAAVPAISEGLTGFLLTPEYSCEHEWGSCVNHQWYTALTTEHYIEKILLHKPAFLKKDNYLNYLYSELDSANKTANEPRKTLSFVHFTDLHVDLDYVVGSNKTCNNVMCCRSEDGMATDPSNAAGPYGSLALCDVPAATLYKMGDKINELQPDVVFWTGDVVPHDQW